MNKPPQTTNTENHTATPARRRKYLWKQVREWAASFLIALFLALFLTQVVLLNAKVPSPSMVPTISPQDQLLGLRTAYWFSDPQRGDVIIFYYPDNEEELYVKRIIGMPGDLVDIRDGKVYINGSQTPLNEPYLAEKPHGDFGPYKVPSGSYFVMGDNRNRSWDSRYWQNTYVYREKILGKAWLRILPSLAFIQ